MFVFLCLLSQVTVSMLEIYSEQVRDLLNPVKQKGGLKVGENPGKGFVGKCKGPFINTVPACHKYR